MMNELLPILSSNALVHENCDIAEWVLIKGGCRVNNNVPPFTIMAHNPIEYYGVNAYILRKGKKSEATIDDIAKCYRHIYQSQTSPFNALKRIETDVDPSTERDEILKFITPKHNAMHPAISRSRVGILLALRSELIFENSIAAIVARAEAIIATASCPISMQPTIIPQYIMPDNVRTVNFLSSIFVSKFNDAAKLAILTQNCNMQLQRTVILWYLI